MKQLLIFIALFTLFETTLEAQFLNRLKKSIQRGAEEAVLDKAEEETYKQASKAISKMLENKMKNYWGTDSLQFIAKDQLPGSYEFDWTYQLTMDMDDSRVVMDYFLKRNGNYMGTTSEQMEGMIMVFDPENHAFVTYMENDGEKMAMAMEIPQMETTGEDSVFNNSFTFEKTGNTKEILGYSCEEFVGENPDYRYLMYITQEHEVGFGSIYKMDQQRLPSGFDPEWLENGKGLMMEMEMTDKNKKKNNVTTITCTRLEKYSLVLNNDEYQFWE